MLKKMNWDFQIVLANIPAVLFRGYADGSIDLFDRKVEAMTGYTKEEFETRQRKWTDLILETDRDLARRAVCPASPSAPQRLDPAQMTVVVAREDLGELLARQLPPLRVKSRAPPRRVQQRAEKDERVLAEPPEFLRDGRGIGFGVLQEARRPVVVEHPEHGALRKRHLREALLINALDVAHVRGVLDHRPFSGGR